MIWNSFYVEKISVDFWTYGCHDPLRILHTVCFSSLNLYFHILNIFVFIFLKKYNILMNFKSAEKIRTFYVKK